MYPERLEKLQRGNASEATVIQSREEREKRFHLPEHSLSNGRVSDGIEHSTLLRRRVLEANGRDFLTSGFVKISLPSFSLRSSPVPSSKKSTPNCSRMEFHAGSPGRTTEREKREITVVGQDYSNLLSQSHPHRSQESPSL